MSSRLDERLNRAEAAVAPELRQVIVWRELGETPGQAKARHIAKHPDDQGAELLLVGWQEPSPDETLSP